MQTGVALWWEPVDFFRQHHSRYDAHCPLSFLASTDVSDSVLGCCKCFPWELWMVLMVLKVLCCLSWKPACLLLQIFAPILQLACFFILGTDLWDFWWQPSSCFFSPDSRQGAFIPFSHGIQNLHGPSYWLLFSLKLEKFQWAFQRVEESEQGSHKVSEA